MARLSLEFRLHVEREETIFFAQTLCSLREISNGNENLFITNSRRRKIDA